MDQDINFTLNFVDNITASVNRIEGSVGSLEKKMDDLGKRTKDQEIGFIAQVQAVRSVDIGLRGISNVTGELIGQNNALTKALRGTSTAVHAVSSAFQLVKGARQIILMLKQAEVGLGVVEAFRAGLRGKLGLVFLGIAGGAAAAGYLAGQASTDNSTTVNQTVNFNPYSDQSSQRNTVRETLDSIGG